MFFMAVVLGLAVTVSVCGCKKSGGFDADNPGPDINKTSTEKAATMMKGKGPGDPPPGLGGTKK